MDGDVVVPAEVAMPQTNIGYWQNMIIDAAATRRRRFQYIRKLSTRWRRNVVGSNPIMVPAEAEAAANWAELPRDMVYEIFCRLPHVDDLESAGLVCSSWRRIAVEEPMLWRHIDIAFDWEEYVGIPYDLDPDYFNFNTKETPAWLLAMTRAAVDRSAGRCESFCGPVDCNLLLHLAASSPSLRSIQVTSFFRLHREFVGRVLPKLPMLERLVIPRGYITCTTLRAFIDYCPRLQLLDAGGCYMESNSVCVALFEWLLQTKVVTMPQLPFPPDELYIRTQEDEVEIGAVIGRYF